MPNPLVAVAGATVGGAAVSAKASRDAADAQTEAAQDSNATQLYIYNDQKKRLQPYERTGKNALAALASSAGVGGARYYGDFRKSPGYGFQMDEGNQALERRAAASGLRLSGSSLKDAMRFNQGLADQEFGNYQNRLASIAGIGQTATSQLGQAGQSYAGAVGQNNAQIGAARASGYQGTANAVNGGINNAFSIYGAHQAGYFG